VFVLLWSGSNIQQKQLSCIQQYLTELSVFVIIQFNGCSQLMIKYVWHKLPYVSDAFIQHLHIFGAHAAHILLVSTFSRSS